MLKVANIAMVSWHTVYIIGKEKYRSTRWCNQICHFVVACL